MDSIQSAYANSDSEEEIETRGLKKMNEFELNKDVPISPLSSDSNNIFPLPVDDSSDKFSSNEMLNEFKDSNSEQQWKNFKPNSFSVSFHVNYSPNKMLPPPIQVNGEKSIPIQALANAHPFSIAKNAPDHNNASCEESYFMNGAKHYSFATSSNKHYSPSISSFPSSSSSSSFPSFSSSLYPSTASDASFPSNSLYQNSLAPSFPPPPPSTCTSTPLINDCSTNFKVNNLSLSSQSLPSPYISKRKRENNPTSTETHNSSQRSKHNPDGTLLPEPSNLVDDVPNHVYKTHFLSNYESLPPYKNYEAAIPNRRKFEFPAHEKPISCVKWSPKFGHLLASAGADGLIKIWKIFSPPGIQLGTQLTCHSKGIRDISWSHDSRQILTASLDQTSRLIDVETQTSISEYKREGMVTCVRHFPTDTSLFLSGGVDGFVFCTDMRCGRDVRKFKTCKGRLLDVDVSCDETFMVTSTECSKKSEMDRGLALWNLNSGNMFQNQIYMEGYSAPCVRFHPTSPCFVAQTNGNYVVSFSSKPPFRQIKSSRFQGGHSVDGFPILCNFNCNGKVLVTGSSDGCVSFYHTSRNVIGNSRNRNHSVNSINRNANLGKTLNVYGGDVCVDARFHPVYSSVVATCGWDGRIVILE